MPDVSAARAQSERSEVFPAGHHHTTLLVCHVQSANKTKNSFTECYHIGPVTQNHISKIDFRMSP